MKFEDKWSAWLLNKFIFKENLSRVHEAGLYWSEEIIKWFDLDCRFFLLWLWNKQAKKLTWKQGVAFHSLAHEEKNKTQSWGMFTLSDCKIYGLCREHRPVLHFYCSLRPAKLGEGKQPIAASPKCFLKARVGFKSHLLCLFIWLWDQVALNLWHSHHFSQQKSLLKMCFKIDKMCSSHNLRVLLRQENV